MSCQNCQTNKSIPSTQMPHTKELIHFSRNDVDVIDGVLSQEEKQQSLKKKSISKVKRHHIFVFRFFESN